MVLVSILDMKLYERPIILTNNNHERIFLKIIENLMLFMFTVNLSNQGS